MKQRSSLRRKARIKGNSGHGIEKNTAFDYFLVILFAGILIITLYPFLNVLAISFNDSMDTLRDMNFIIPRKFTFANYTYLFSKKNLGHPLFISVARTVIGTCVSLICTLMLAYTLSRKDFVFHKLFTILFVVTMYISGGLIPEYLLIARTLKMSNTFGVYIIPGLISVFNVILVRSFIEGLPTALEESACIDGANDFVIWLKIIVPLCKPVTATIVLFCAVGQWNSFMDTYLYCGTQDGLKTLQYVLYEILNSTGVNQNMMHNDSSLLLQATTTPQTIRMAITVIATVPIVVTYPLLQRYFVGGMTLGAVKS